MAVTIRGRDRIEKGFDMPKITTSADFWANVNKVGTCWLWAGNVDKIGYGRYRLTYAHRYAYELHTGRMIRKGRQVDHMCHNRSCINPDHLRSVTNKQNGENRKGPNSNNTSGILGVSWNKRHEKWRAQFTHNRKSIYVGMFDRIEDAEKAIIASRNRVFTCNQNDRARASRKAPECPPESGPTI